MTRRAPRWLAAPLFLALIAAPARAADDEVKPEDQSGFWGYFLAGIFSCSIVFAVCKPAHRELNTPKPGQTKLY